MKQKVIIIGAGVTGLSAAYKLLKSGHDVIVIEKGSEVGGLAGSFILDHKPVDKYYHFICKEDNDLLDLSDELGLSENLHWKEGSTACYVQGDVYPFNTPVDLLRFAPIPFTQRLRLGIHALVSQKRKRWQSLDRVPAKQWLIGHIGYEAYMAIWDPLLRIKFGEAHEDISAAWIWHRIHRVATSRNSLMGANTYGYFEQGCFTFMDRLAQKVEEFKGATIIKGQSVSSIKQNDGKVTGVELVSDKELILGDSVISTMAINDFLSIAPPMGEFSDNLSKIKYLNVACLFLHLKAPYTEHFWFNVNDPAISFNGIVEVTNLNPRPDMDNCHLAYIPFYVAEGDPHWSASDQEIFHECLIAMMKIKPGFSEDHILDYRVYRDKNAQAICSVGFLGLTPPFITPIKGLYITDSSQYYPEDRNLSASVKLADQVVKSMEDRISRI